MNKYTKMLRKYREQQREHEDAKKESKRIEKLLDERYKVATEILMCVVEALKSTILEHGFSRCDENAQDSFKYEYYISPDHSLKIKIPRHTENYFAVYEIKDLMEQLSAYFGEKDA